MGSDKQWRNDPWTEEKKTARDLLADIIFDTASLLQGLDHFRRCSHKPLKECERLLIVTVAIRKRLDKLLGPTVTQDAKFDYTKTGAKLPPRIMNDDDIHQLLLLHQYWVLCMCIDTTQGFLACYKKHIISGFITEGYSMSDEEAIGILTESRIFCDKIANTVGLVFDPSFGIAVNGLGLYSLGFALRMLTAIEPHLEDPSPERWILIEIYMRKMLGKWTGAVLQHASESKMGCGIIDERALQQTALRWWAIGREEQFITRF